MNKELTKNKNTIANKQSSILKNKKNKTKTGPGTQKVFGRF